MIVTFDIKNIRLDKEYLLLARKGWSGGAMVLGKLPEPTNLDQSRARAYCSCSKCWRGLFGHFSLSSFVSLFFFPLFGPI